MARTHAFTFLGTGAGCGVPAFFCSCAACEEARRVPHARRGDCGVMVEGRRRLIIDAPPDLRQQLVREDARTLDRVLLTHAHYDHIGGLGELEYYVHLVAGEPLGLHASAETLAQVKQEFDFMGRCLEPHVLRPFEQMEFDGAVYTALPVSHAPGTFGFLVETEETRLFYASDTARLPARTAEMVRGVDVAVLDATYWRRNGSPEAHHSVQEAVEEGFELEAGSLYLTHLAMHYAEPVTLAELEAYLAPYGGRVCVAYDGLRLKL